MLVSGDRTAPVVQWSFTGSIGPGAVLDAPTSFRERLGPRGSSKGPGDGGINIVATRLIRARNWDGT